MSNKLDVMMIQAGDVIHYKGHPLYVTDNTRVMGCAANFVTDNHGLFLSDSKIPEPIRVNADGSPYKE